MVGPATWVLRYQYAALAEETSAIGPPTESKFSFYPSLLSASSTIATLWCWPVARQ